MCANQIKPNQFNLIFQETYLRWIVAGSMVKNENVDNKTTIGIMQYYIVEYSET